MVDPPGQQVSAGEIYWPPVGTFRVHQRGGSCPSTGRISWPPTPVVQRVEPVAHAEIAARLGVERGTVDTWRHETCSPHHAGLSVG